VEAKTGDNGGYGNYVLLKHNIGGKEVFTRYSHLNKLGDVKPGDIVKQGQQVGYLGNSGNTTKNASKPLAQQGGFHIDFEAFMLDNGKKKFLKTDNLYK
jgi:hypothetical protein